MKRTKVVLSCQWGRLSRDMSLCTALCFVALLISASIVDQLRRPPTRVVTWVGLVSGRDPSGSALGAFVRDDRVAGMLQFSLSQLRRWWYKSIERSEGMIGRGSVYIANRARIRPLKLGRKGNTPKARIVVDSPGKTPC